MVGPGIGRPGSIQARSCGGGVAGPLCSLPLPAGRPPVIWSIPGVRLSFSPPLSLCSWFLDALISASPLLLCSPWPAAPRVPPHISQFSFSFSPDLGMLLSGVLGHPLILVADATSFHFLHSPLSASGQATGMRTCLDFGVKTLLGSNSGPHSTLSLTSHWCHGLSPWALQGVLVKMQSNSWLLSPILGSPTLVPTLSLTPCTSPYLPRSLPNPVTPCGPGVWEEEAGIPLGKPAQLPHSCKCQNVFDFLKSPQICNSAAVSLNVCCWPWEASCPQPQPQHCPPGC